MGLRGRLLGGRYELQSLVATGGMGEVWRARDARLGRVVAVKVVGGGGVTGDPTFRTRFRAEAQHAALLNHPNIAAVHDYGEEPPGDGPPVAWLVMELVDGEPLSDLLRRAGRLGVGQTLDIVRQTASALAAAHAAGVVHRDVKPANVLVRPDGVVKITDFGIAWSATSAPVTRTGQVVGTAHYIAPEQVEGDKATPASDVYALGLVTWECLSGRRAFDGESAVQVALRQVREPLPPLPPDVPPSVRELVARATVKDPAQRLADGAAFRDAVDGVLADEPAARAATLVDPLAGARPTSAPPPTAVFEGFPATEPPGEEPAPRARPRALLAAVVLVAVAVVTAVVVAASGGSRGGAGATAAGSSSVPASSAGPSSAAPTTAAPTAAAPTVAQIALVSAQWVGRPVDEVQQALTAMGLQVQLAPVQTTAAPANQVLGISPDGQLAPGSTVTVSYAVAPPAPPAPTKGHPGPGRKHGDG